MDLCYLLLCNRNYYLHICISKKSYEFLLEFYITFQNHVVLQHIPETLVPPETQVPLDPWCPRTPGAPETLVPLEPLVPPEPMVPPEDFGTLGGPIQYPRSP